MKCMATGCDSTPGPEDIEIKHRGRTVGFLCPKCYKDALEIQFSLTGDPTWYRVDGYILFKDDEDGCSTLKN